MIFVIKANGKKEPFSEDKLRHSIQRAGIPNDMQDKVVAHVQSNLVNNISTKDVYSHIVEFLDTSGKPFAKTRYRLKQAIMDLGPTGYPFEDFVADLLQTQGYICKVRQIVSGNCITHEVDVVAQKDNTKAMIEVKFHNVSGLKTKVHVALYTKARFDDVKEKNNFTEAWLVTNTKITQDAIEYANCNSIKIISWKYPENEGLRDLIERSGLTPITVLTQLSTAQKQELLAKDIVVCKQICENASVLDVLGLSAEKKNQIHEESFFACKTQ